MPQSSNRSFKMRKRSSRSKTTFLSIGLSWLVIALSSGACVLLVVLFVKLSSTRTLSQLEAILFQLIILATSVVVSYLLSLKSARVTAHDMVKAHVRPAFRRVVSLYSSLSRLAIRIEELRNDPSLDTKHALDVIDAVVREQIPTGADTLGDWRDILPEDVKDLEEKAYEEEQ